MDDPLVQDTLGCLLLFVVFAACCALFVASTRDHPARATPPANEGCLVPGGFFQTIDVDYFERRREFGCVRHLVYHDLGAPSPLVDVP